MGDGDRDKKNYHCDVTGKLRKQKGDGSFPAVPLLHGRCEIVTET